MFMKIGDLAKSVGITVRTLHHYHQIGLLIPSHMTEGGHRLYTEEDVQKLYHIMALKNFGFGLEEIRDMMHSVNADPSILVDLQLKKATEMLAMQQKLCESLKKVQGMLRAQKSPSVHDMIEMIMMMQMNTKHYLTDKQISQIKDVYLSLPVEEEKELKEGWRSFISRLKRCYKENTPTDDPEARALVDDWERFVKTVTGNDPGIIEATYAFHAENAGNKHNYLRNGLTPELFKYLGRAMQASDVNQKGQDTAD
ncbi:MerR family transcriptional regulator [Paenibacillus sp.]|uniref:MerR family transcriptional regulator n=1 Tax=Paenibacillus sp. TaxID=58172 RepID=UPI00282F9909|nr:MerR family transcriptional regulator [Paenibacillus sp.]MDR0269030.1 MerR family transcriptional regulator [Paenibacillus sp.]